MPFRHVRMAGFYSPPSAGLPGQRTASPRASPRTDSEPSSRSLSEGSFRRLTRKAELRRRSSEGGKDTCVRPSTWKPVIGLPLLAVLGVALIACTARPDFDLER